MRLPDLDRAHIPPAKIRDYLLDPAHPVGKAKARFFNGLGFRRARWAALRSALLDHAATGQAEQLPVGEFGQKYLVRGIIQGRNGTRAALVSIWILTPQTRGPRFVTAYPEDLP